jgi:hypothetical protein
VSAIAGTRPAGGGRVRIWVISSVPSISGMPMSEMSASNPPFWIMRSASAALDAVCTVTMHCAIT